MDIDLVFLPLAEELIDVTFPTAIVYLQTSNDAYDPATGQASNTVTEHNINAGVLSRGRTEGGGVEGTLELRLWIHHGANGYPNLPTTRDRVIYDDTVWKIVSVDPTYSSKDLIASKLLVRAI